MRLKCRRLRPQRWNPCCGNFIAIPWHLLIMDALIYLAPQRLWHVLRQMK